MAITDLSGVNNEEAVVEDVLVQPSAVVQGSIQDPLGDIMPDSDALEQDVKNSLAAETELATRINDFSFVAVLQDPRHMSEVVDKELMKANGGKKPLYPLTCGVQVKANTDGSYHKVPLIGGKRQLQYYNVDSAKKEEVTYKKGDILNLNFIEALLLFGGAEFGGGIIGAEGDTTRVRLVVKAKGSVAINRLGESGTIKTEGTPVFKEAGKTEDGKPKWELADAKFEQYAPLLVKASAVKKQANKKAGANINAKNIGIHNVLKGKLGIE